MHTKEVNFDVVSKAWLELKDNLPGINGIQSESEYEDATNVLNGIIDIVGNNEDHPLAGLMTIIGNYIEEYDKKY